MDNKPKDEFREMMNSFIDHLKSNGLSVSNAAILNLGGDGSQDDKKQVEQEVARVLREMGKARFPGGAMPSGEMNKDNGPRGVPEFKGKCFCPMCFNFDTFEEVLKDLGGNFDYATVQLGGKLFDLKYWISPTGKEKIIVSPQKKQEVGPSYDNLPLEKLQEALNIAVNSKDFSEAQVILDAINKTKNKN